MSNNSSSSASSGGIGFAGLLTIAFVVLKLCKVIDWNWWWVISPSLIQGIIFISKIQKKYWIGVTIPYLKTITQ